MFGGISFIPLFAQGALGMTATQAGSLLTPQANTVGELITLRFLTGLGLGGAMPNVVALASEYAPKRLQPILVTLIFVGMGGGAVLATSAASCRSRSRCYS